MFLDFESVHSYLPTGFAIFPPIISQKTCMTVCPFSSFTFFFFGGGGGGREREYQFTYTIQIRQQHTKHMNCNSSV